MIWIRGEIIPDEALRGQRPGPDVRARPRPLRDVPHLERPCDAAAPAPGPACAARPASWACRSTRRLARRRGRRCGCSRRAASPARTTSASGSPCPAAWRARDGLGATLWMTAGPLPPPMTGRGAPDRSGRSCVDPDDPLARHKTLNYWRRRIAQERAARGWSRRGPVRHARRPDLRGDPYEPVPGPRRSPDHARDRTGRSSPASCAGSCSSRRRIGRARGRGRPGAARTRIAAADEAFLTNSVRGMVPVARLLRRRLTGPRARDRDACGTRSSPGSNRGGTTP